MRRKRMIEEKKEAISLNELYNIPSGALRGSLEFRRANSYLFNHDYRMGFSQAKEVYLHLLDDFILELSSLLSDNHKLPSKGQTERLKQINKLVNRMFTITETIKLTKA